MRGIASPAYNVDNQYTSSQFVYDGAGNPTTYWGHAATYDEESRLTTLLADTHGYTADGMRSSKQIGTNARTYFLYDGNDVVCELDSNGNVIATNTWGGSGLVARTTAARTVCYAFDPQGNVSQAIDPNAVAGSQILNTCSADAYGYRYASGTYTDPYMGFGGKWGYYTDTEVGTQLLGHRFYDSGAGRFINRDPIGYEGGNNHYRYVGNSPLGGIDPSGFALIPEFNGPPKESGGPGLGRRIRIDVECRWENFKEWYRNKFGGGGKGPGDGTPAAEPDPGQTYQGSDGVWNIPKRGEPFLPPITLPRIDVLPATSGTMCVVGGTTVTVGGILGLVLYYGWPVLLL